MERRSLRLASAGATAVLGLVASAEVARAQTTVNCTSVPGALVNLTQSGSMSAGEYRIEGKCVGNVFLAVPGVTLDTSPVGATAVQINGSVTVAASDIALGSASSGLVIDGTSTSAGTNGIDVVAGTTALILSGVTVQNFSGLGISAAGPGTMFIEGGQIAGNTSCGLSAFSGMNVELDDLGGNTSLPPVITGNGVGTTSALQCGIDIEDNAILLVTDVNVHDNLKGPALVLYQASGDIQGGTFQAPSSVTVPAAVFENSKADFNGVTFTGTGHSDVIFATPGNSIIMQNTIVTESDATATDSTILIEDGSTLLSLGGNTITNSAANGQAITVGNASTFRQKIETSLGVPILADTINGKGAILIESNMDLGTGSSAPSTWNGNINVSQNSSFRVEGGLTINGSVSVAQASNAFFNLANNPGMANNVITGGVLCPFTSAQSSHVSVSGNAAVTSSGGSTSAVTFGSAANNCLPF